MGAQRLLGLLKQTAQVPGLVSNRAGGHFVHPEHDACQNCYNLLQSVSGSDCINFSTIHGDFHWPSNGTSTPGQPLNWRPDGLA
jgi:hypothetical protein